MRLFLAVDLDEPLRQSAGRMADRIRSAAAIRQARAVTWVEPENLHVTLHFLGEIEDVRARDLIQRLAPPLAAPAFEMGLGRAGVFPPQGPPRVVWIGIEPGASAMDAVHRELAERLTTADVPVERRPLRAHVTIARLKQPVFADLRGLASGAAPAAAGRCRVEHVTLYRSHLGPHGPRYEALARIPLTCP